MSAKKLTTSEKLRRALAKNPNADRKTLANKFGCSDALVAQIAAASSNGHPRIRRKKKSKTAPTSVQTLSITVNGVQFNKEQLHVLSQFIK